MHILSGPTAGVNPAHRSDPTQPTQVNRPAGAGPREARAMSQTQPEPISPTDPHEFETNGNPAAVCRKCGCCLETHRVNGVTLDEFADEVERMTDLGGLGRKLRIGDVFHPWFASCGIRETARRILGTP